MAGPKIDFSSFRTWQQEALTKYFSGDFGDFLVVATPGSGKTTFGLAVAKRLLAERVVRKIVVVVPTDHLKKQWSLAAKNFHINLDASFSNTAGSSSQNLQGEVLTYAQVARHPFKHAARVDAVPTLVLFDEIHHGGDNLTWGEALLSAFKHASRRLALTGTPFRSDYNRIPFINYREVSAGVFQSVPDYIYDYEAALQDKVVRPVMFLAYSGTATWETDAGEYLELKLGDNITKKQTSILWKNALDVNGEWIKEVFKAAHVRLLQHRASGMKDAGGLVLATDKQTAHDYAQILEQITGQKATVVVSDTPNSSSKIVDFSTNDNYWLVAVRMVSEGVDIPRLTVGVYATSTATDLFFAQVIGRFVRARNSQETASIFLPSVPELLKLASNIEKQRNHIVPNFCDSKLLSEEFLDEEILKPEADSFKSIESNINFTSTATLDKLIYDGSAIGLDKHLTAEEVDEYEIGIPGLLNKEQIDELLRNKKTTKVDHKLPNKQADNLGSSTVSLEVELKELRKQLNTLVSLENHRTGKPHGIIHKELRDKLGGPPTALANTDQLKARIKLLKNI